MNSLKSLADYELVEMYSKGNDKAFDELLTRYQSKLYSYIFFIVRNVTLAEDLFQETFMKVITTIRQGSYAESGRFGAWLTRIAHNLIIDYFRQDKGDNVVSNDETEVDLFNDADLSDDDVETKLVNAQVLSDVRRLVGALPRPQREVVYMRFYQDLSFREIADITGVSINTSLGRMRYALINMRRMARQNEMHLSLEL